MSNTTTLTRITASDADALAQDWRGCDEFGFFLDHVYASGALCYLASTDTHFAIRVAAKLGGNTPTDTMYAFHIGANADHYMDCADTADLDEDTLAFYGIGGE